VEAALPVRVADGRVVAGDQRYEGPDLAYMLLYPNPLNAERYVAVYSATSPRALSALPAAYTQMKALRPADVGVCSVAQDGGIRWHILECFSTTWAWQDGYTRPVLTLQRGHPVWQWQQWLAAALRQRLGADAVFLDEPFLFAEALPAGPVTPRDLFNSFKNDWMIQVSMRGADLRKMATAPFINPAGPGGATGQENPKFAFPNAGTGGWQTRPVATQRLASLPRMVVDGLTLTAPGSPGGGKVLTVAELQNDRRYRVVIAEPGLKGEPLGVVPQDYQIIGTSYLIPLLASILDAAGGRDVDAELERFRFRL
jgi:hypothetical protein